MPPPYLAPEDHARNDSGQHQQGCPVRQYFHVSLSREPRDADQAFNAVAEIHRLGQRGLVRSNFEQRPNLEQNFPRSIIATILTRANDLVKLFGRMVAQFRPAVLATLLEHPDTA